MSLRPRRHRQREGGERLGTAPPRGEAPQRWSDWRTSLEALSPERGFGLDARLGEVVGAELERRPVSARLGLFLGLHLLLLPPQQGLVQGDGLVPGGTPQLLSGGSRHGLEEAGEVLAETVAAHGDEGHAENDV